MAFSAMLLSFLQGQVEWIVRRVKKKRLVTSWAPGLIWASLIVWALARAAAFGMHLPCPVAEAVWLCGCRGTWARRWRPRSLLRILSSISIQNNKSTKQCCCFSTFNKKKRDRIWALTDSVSMTKRITLDYGSESCLASVFCSAVLHPLRANTLLLMHVNYAFMLIIKSCKYFI